MNKKQIEKFLMVSLFGANYEKDPISAAINRAYRDFCRTLRMDENVRKKAKEDGSSEIGNSINTLSGNYDEWFYRLCDALTNNKIGYTFGQAQKWINMTMKYLIILNKKPVESYIKDLHAPIDNYIIKTAFDNGFKTEDWKKADSFSWSSKDFDETKYKSIKEWISEQAKKENISPIEWEFKSWNESTAKDK